VTAPAGPAPIVESGRAVALLGGAPVSDGLLDEVLALCGPVIAADSGAAHALARGIVPRAVIGDMDSLDPALADRLAPDRLHRIAEQDSTDFDKALRHVAAPLVIGAGFTGARMDHLLAALNVLGRRADRRCILAGEADAAFLCPPRLELDLPPGAVLSLFPLGPVSGRSEGLRWPIAGLDFAPLGRSGTSNEVTGPVVLEMDAPRMLVLTPRAALAEAARRLLSAPARWPAP